MVRGLGGCLPPRVVTNDALVAGGLDTSDEWVRSRTGIVERRWCGEGVSTADLAVAAGRGALESSGGAGPVDAVVVATTTPDRSCPGLGPEVAWRLGLDGAAGFDVSAVCSGFVYGLWVASGLVASGARGVLVAAAERYSSILDRTDRGTGMIFGDGAGAALVMPGGMDEPGAVVALDAGSDGSGRDLITVPAGERFFRMQGPSVYREAVRCMVESARRVMQLAGWAPEELGAFVGHQANQRILDAVSDRLGVPAGAQVGNIERVGNTAGASIPLVMCDKAAADVEPGAPGVLTAFGGGLTWGSVALRWPDAAPLWGD
ncbi:beta-ketoacyl-ACP synthase 3 [Streptomyces sp. TR06-5]|uniref:beta-ketoacyl-ACP synthase 3 n=1 Tax=unclassified Streptomyces TaxID=2593676 RepID=UPI0039A23C1C